SECEVCRVGLTELIGHCYGAAVSARYSRAATDGAVNTQNHALRKWSVRKCELVWGKAARHCRSRDLDGITCEVTRFGYVVACANSSVNRDFGGCAGCGRYY